MPPSLVYTEPNRGGVMTEQSGVAEPEACILTSSLTYNAAFETTWNSDIANSENCTKRHLKTWLRLNKKYPQLQ